MEVLDQDSRNAYPAVHLYLVNYGVVAEGKLHFAGTLRPFPRRLL